jgi:hypothetical protein
MSKNNEPQRPWKSSLLRVQSLRKAQSLRCTAIGQNKASQLSFLPCGLRQSPILVPGRNAVKCLIWCVDNEQTSQPGDQGSSVSRNVSSWNSSRLCASFLEKGVKERNHNCWPKTTVLHGPVSNIDRFAYRPAYSDEGNTAWILQKGMGGILIWNSIPV